MGQGKGMLAWRVESIPTCLIFSLIEYASGLQAKSSTLRGGSSISFFSAYLKTQGQKDKEREGYVLEWRYGVCVEVCCVSYNWFVLVSMPPGEVC